MKFCEEYIYISNGYWLMRIHKDDQPIVDIFAQTLRDNGIEVAGNDITLGKGKMVDAVLMDIEEKWNLIERSADQECEYTGISICDEPHRDITIIDCGEKLAALNSRYVDMVMKPGDKYFWRGQTVFCDNRRLMFAFKPVACMTSIIIIAIKMSADNYVRHLTKGFN
jgi:hypothetical protein